MSLWQLLLVAVVQGLTEYLPISSSAHLILLPWVFELPDQGLSVDIAAHSGTFVAAVVYFRSDLGSLARGLRSGGPGRRLGLLLVAGSWPVLICGWLLRDQIASVARNPLLIAVTSIVFGIVLWGADRMGRRRRTIEELGWRQATLVGLSQALALIPGTSRSGATISAGLLFDLRRDEAARFSFLLSLPVGAAVALSELLEMRGEAGGLDLSWSLLLVFVVSGVVGHACIAAFLKFVRERGMAVFAIYRLLLGAVLLWVFL